MKKDEVLSGRNRKKFWRKTLGKICPHRHGEMCGEHSNSPCCYFCRDYEKCAEKWLTKKPTWCPIMRDSRWCSRVLKAYKEEKEAGIVK